MNHISGKNPQCKNKIHLEIAADYLVMSAWLTYLKSRLLLPKDENIVADITGAYLLGYDVIQYNQSKQPET